QSRLCFSGRPKRWWIYFPSSVKKGDTSDFDALPPRCFSRRVGVHECAVQTEGAGYLGVTSIDNSARRPGLSELPRRIPLFDQNSLVTCHEGIVPPFMIWRVLCKVVLAYTIVIMNFEYDQIVTRQALPVAQSQRIRHDGRTVDIAPYVDQGESSMFLESTRHNLGAQDWFATR